MDAAARAVCLLNLAVGASAWAAAPPLRYVASTAIQLDFTVANAASVIEAEVWLSTDSCRSWRRIPADRTGTRTLTYSAPDEGRYDFVLVLRNEAGPSAEPPAAGTPAACSVVVDTTPPLLQALAAAAGDCDTPPCEVTFRATLVEENLAEGAVHVFFRERGVWIDGGVARPAGEHLVWQPPGHLAGVTDLRLVATDLAGNQSSSELRQVRLPGATHRSAPPDAAPPATAPTAATPSDLPADTELPPLPPAGAPPDLHRVEQLRAQAAAFLSSGRHALGLARLEEATDLAPRDPNLLVELGDALVQAGRLDDARARFSSARALVPNHVGALEGLALVAAAEKRYPEARAHLRDLQRHRPDAASVWLRSGDIAHRLGESAEAVAAWERVLRLEGADPDTRARAQRRLDSFGPQRAAAPASSASSRAAWPTPATSRLSSSSTVTTSTRKTAP